MTYLCTEQILIRLMQLGKPGNGVLLEVGLLIRTHQKCALPIEANIHKQTAAYRLGSSDTTGQLVVGLTVGEGEKSVMRQSTLTPES